MALRPEQVEEWVAENGPWLYRSCSDEEAARFVEVGIEPAPDPRSDEQRPYLSPRRDCAYIGTKEYLGAECPIRVDIRELDPAALVVDEDQVALHAADFAEAVPLPHPLDGPSPTLGQWVDELDFDDPENVMRSLRRGSVAVKGGVPREAIERVG
jgi:hypothetical protein